MVDAQFDELASHLTAELAAELRADVAAGDVARTPGMAEQTLAGRLALLSPTRRRAYLLDHDRHGHTFTQVTSLEENGDAASASFRGGELVGGHVGTIRLEPPPPDDEGRAVRDGLLGGMIGDNRPDESGGRMSSDQGPRSTTGWPAPHAALEAELLDANVAVKYRPEFGSLRMPMVGRVDKTGWRCRRRKEATLPLRRGSLDR